MQAVKKFELTNPVVLTSPALASPLFPLLGTPVLLRWKVKRVTTVSTSTLIRLKLQSILAAMSQKDRTNNKQEIIRAKLNDPAVLTLFPLFGAPVSLEA